MKVIFNQKNHDEKSAFIYLGKKYKNNYKNSHFENINDIPFNLDVVHLIL